MGISFINQLQKLQKLMLEDNHNDSTRPKARLNSVHLLKAMIEPVITQKKQMGIYPRKRLIDQRFREKVRQNSDINVINSKVISKNYHLRTAGDNDRALGIELLIEELFRRKTILSERNINMVTFVGERVPIKITKHAEIVKLLLELEQISELDHIKKPRYKGGMVDLPITMKHVNALISERNVNEGYKYSMNHNFVNMLQTENNKSNNDFNF